MRFTLENIEQAAEKFLQEIGNNRVIAFYAPMGTGKTTFIKAICDKLGVDETVTSPTFAIVNEYCDAEKNPVYHFDFYRIKKASEVADIGFDEYAYSGNLCLIEWPELIEDLLPEDTLRVAISECEDSSREWKFM